MGVPMNETYGLFGLVLHAHSNSKAMVEPRVHVMRGSAAAARLRSHKVPEDIRSDVATGKEQGQPR